MVVETLGAGGEARVVKALDQQHDRVVALKIRTVRSGGAREDLLAEARILLGVPPHEHLPLVREDFFDDGQYVVAMDWVEGTNLARLLRTQGRPGLSPSSVMRWLSDAASALTHLHTLERPVIHGDVKPANLILTRGGRVVLVDFGLSSSPDGLRRRAGTRGYAAPELMAGEGPSRASDIYSLAATGFALLTGAAPSGIRPSWDGLDPAEAEQLEQVLRLGLATDPARRPQTPGEFLERLRAGWGQTLPTGVLTFCMTDIEGSTSMWDAQPAAMAQALVRHDELIASAVEAGGGRFIKSMGEGDATVSVFADPAKAVAAVFDMNRRLGTEEWPDGLQLRVRTALHTGEAERRDETYFGAALNIAARIRGLGDGGEVLLSHVTADLVRDRMTDGASLVDLGPHRLRGVRDTEQVFAIAAPGISTPKPATECPYPGLLPFQPDDRELFFGREEVAGELLRRVRGRGFVAVVGGSGSGKSSVLRAGVLPAFGPGEVMTPGEHPSVPDVAGLLVVDQFEEVFTRCDEEDVRTRFIDGLLAREQPVAIALRADFYGRCANHASLAEAVARDQVLLGPMSADELRRAVTEPARAAGLRVEEGLVDLLVAEVEGEPGALPLLAHTLHATWERRDGRRLTLEGYHATGGVRGAIASTADRVLDELDASDQELARTVFLRLVEPGETVDTRRRAALAELGGDRASTVVGTLSAARLVILDEGAVEVAHEALIREWPRFQAWIDEGREGLRIHRHVTSSATAWDSLGRVSSELYRGPRLATAVDWLASDPDLSTLERDFIDASRREEVRSTRRRRALVAGMAVALVVAVIAGAVALVLRGRAADERDRADVSRIAAVSRSVIERSPDLGMLLAVEAHRLRDDADTRSTMLAAVEEHPQLLGLLQGTESGLEAAIFSPDGKLLATPTSDGSGTLLWDVATRERIAVLRHGRRRMLGGAISPDGRWLVLPAIREEDGRPIGVLQVWDLRSRRFVRETRSPGGALSSAAFSRDGRVLVTQGGPRVGGPFPTIAIVWDTATWEPRGKPWALIDEYVGDRRIALSGDGRLIASPTPAGGVKVFDVGTRTEIGKEIPATERAGDLASEVTALAFTPDASVLAIGTDVGPILLVDPSTGRSLATLSQEAYSTSLEWSRDGRLLASGRNDGRTQFFDRKGTPVGLQLAANASEVNDVSFSDDGRRFATAGVDRTGAIWALDGLRTIGKPLRGPNAAITQAAWIDEQQFVTAETDRGIVFRDAAGVPSRRTRVRGEAFTVAVDTKRGRIVVGGTGGVRTLGLDGERGSHLDLDGGWANTVAVDPATGFVAVGVDNTRGNWEAAIKDPGHVRVWDPSTGDEIGPRIRTEQNGIPVAVAWAPVGNVIAVSTDGNFLTFHDGETHRRVGKPIESVDAPIPAIAFSPDGTRLAGGTTSGEVRQWSVRTRRQIGSALAGHTGGVGGVIYSADGSLLASTTYGTARTRLWDAGTGASIGDELVAGTVPYTERTYPSDDFFASRPAFSPKDTHLVTAGPGGASALWDLRPGTWTKAACSLVSRDLTSAEWTRYLPDRERHRIC